MAGWQLFLFYFSFDLFIQYWDISDDFSFLCTILIDNWDKKQCLPFSFATFAIVYVNDVPLALILKIKLKKVI